MEPLEEFRGASPAMHAIREQARRIVRHAAPGRKVPAILILGETGTGKGLLARALHRASPRAGGPYVTVNCAALPETLMEAELFGYEAGAFTDARRAKPGLFATASTGTLFLDEIATLSLALQAKLLTALEDRVIRRLGSTKNEAVDAWIVAATSEDVAGAVRARRFREDLFHRIAAITFRLPPLRERGNDLVPLAEHFLARACQDYGLPAKRLGDTARAALVRHGWPGNVRELGNVIERGALLSDGERIEADDLSLSMPGSSGPAALAPAAVDGRDDDAPQILAAYRSAAGNLSRAAAALQMPRNTLRYRLARLGALPTRAPLPKVEPAPAAVLDEAPAPPIELGVLFLVVSPVDGSPLSADAVGLLDAATAKAIVFGARVTRVGPSEVLATFARAGADEPIVVAVHAALAILRAIDTAQDGGLPRVFTKVALHVAQDDVEIEADGLLDTVSALAARCEPNSISLSPAAAAAIGPRFRLIAPEAAVAAGGDPSWSVPRSAMPGKPSVAVLPFRRLGGDPADGHLGVGIAQDIVNALSRLHWLRVVGLGTAGGFRADDVDKKSIARSLGVRYLVTGTVRRASDTLRVTAELADASTEHTLLAEHYDGSALDIFAFQDEIAACVTARLDSSVRTAEGHRASQKRPERLDAYECVMRASTLLYRLSEPDHEEARRLLARAIELEPGFAAAHAWMALWFVIRIGQGSTFEGDLAGARRYADASLLHDPDDPLALAISGHLAALADADLERAVTLYDRSLTLNPNSPFAWAHSGATFCYLGEPRTGLDRARYAMRLSPFDPLSFFFYLIAALAEMLAGHYDDAAAWSVRSRAGNPRLAAPHRILAASLVHLGRLDEARQAARESLVAEPQFTLTRFRERYPLRDRAALDRFASALRAAGLPD